MAEPHGHELELGLLCPARSAHACTPPLHAHAHQHLHVHELHRAALLWSPPVTCASPWSPQL